MPGIDLVLPDFTYLRENADRIVGCVATHGHEDHVGGLSFLLRELEFPIIGSALTLGLARNRIEEAGLLDRTEFIPVADNERRQVGPFDLEFLPVTHSVPHGFATAIHTPQGTILHTGDWKLDLNPVDGRLTDLSVHGSHRPERGHPPPALGLDQRRLARPLPLGDLGRRRALQPHARPRGPAPDRHLLRLPHPPGAADRRRRPGLRPAGGHPRAVDEEERARWPARWACCASPTTCSSTSRRSTPSPPGQVCVISTGSQGEPMSALARLAAGENRWLTVRRTTRSSSARTRSPATSASVQQGHRRAHPARRQGRAHRHRRRARHRPRQAGGAEDPASR